MVQMHMLHVLTSLNASLMRVSIFIVLASLLLCGFPFNCPFGHSIRVKATNNTRVENYPELCIPNLFLVKILACLLILVLMIRFYCFGSLLLLEHVQFLNLFLF